MFVHLPASVSAIHRVLRDVFSFSGHDNQFIHACRSTGAPLMLSCSSFARMLFLSFASDGVQLNGQFMNMCLDELVLPLDQKTRRFEDTLTQSTRFLKAGHRLPPELSCRTGE